MTLYKQNKIGLKIVDKQFVITTNSNSIYAFLKNEYLIDLKVSNIYYPIGIFVKENYFKISSPDILIEYKLETELDLYLYVLEYFIRYIIEFFLVKDDILLIHGSAYIYKKKGYLFVGPS